ncbi:hypothetical protein ACOSQ2_031242 [Xanthoceras sorbifolium]
MHGRTSRITISTSEKEMNLEEFIVRLQIKKDNKKSKKMGSSQNEAKTNDVELGKNSKFKSYECRLPKKKKKNEASMVEEISKDVSDIVPSVVVS